MAKQRPEERLQRSIVDLLLWTAPPKLVWFAVPNQRGTRERFEMALLQGLGVRAGVSDLIFALPPTGQIAGLELKARGRKPSPAQIGWGEALVAAGGLWAWTDSIDGAAAILSGWGVKLRVAA